MLYTSVGSVILGGDKIVHTCQSYYINKKLQSVFWSHYMATLYNLTQYHFSSALLPVAYLLHFFLESFALKEDEKRRLLHVIRLSLRRFNQQLVHSQTHTNHSTFYSPSTKNSPVLLHYSC